MCSGNYLGLQYAENSSLPQKVNPILHSQKQNKTNREGVQAAGTLVRSHTGNCRRSRSASSERLPCAGPPDTGPLDARPPRVCAWISPKRFQTPRRVFFFFFYKRFPLHIPLVSSGRREIVVVRCVHASPLRWPQPEAERRLALWRGVGIQTGSLWKSFQNTAKPEPHPAVLMEASVLGLDAGCGRLTLGQGAFAPSRSTDRCGVLFNKGCNRVFSSLWFSCYLLFSSSLVQEYST